MKKILIIGITSQDGYNMLSYLINNNCGKIYGTYHTESKIDKHDKIYSNVTLLAMDLQKENDIYAIIKFVIPDFCFNFASAQPQYEQNNINLFKTNTISTIHILDSILMYNRQCKYLSCGSCWEFGKNKSGVFDLDCKCDPDTMYGITKLSNKHIINYYRNTYNIFCVHVILFNHDSAKRTDAFFLKKIINHFKKVLLGENVEPFVCENIDIAKDWSDSRDFIEAFWLMLNKETPDDYILSSGTSNKLLDFVKIVCSKLLIENIQIVDNDYECKMYVKNKLVFIGKHNKCSPLMIGNNDKTCETLKWKPKISFEQMILDMI